VTTEQKDIGDYLEVPEGERVDVDPAPVYNADAGFDVDVVPDGVVHELSTAGVGETAWDDQDELESMEAADGAPLHFVTPDDPVIAELEKTQED
jgi:hypothetical protein